MFDTIFKWSKLVAVLCVLPITFYICVFLHSLSNTSDQLAATAKALPTQVDTRIGKLQDDVMKKIDTVQDKINTELTTMVNTTDNRIAEITKSSDDRLGKFQDDTFKAIGEIGKNINTQLTTANASITTLTNAYAVVPAQLGQRYNTDFASYFDCSKNKLCLQGQASDTMFAVRQSSRDTSTMMTGFTEFMPKIQDHMLTISNTFARDIPIMTTNIAGITQNINTLTKPKWYDRILGYALNGVVIYRNMNPVTSLTVKGAQVISSQK